MHELTIAYPETAECRQPSERGRGPCKSLSDSAVSEATQRSKLRKVTLTPCSGPTNIVVEPSGLAKRPKPYSTSHTTFTPSCRYRLCQLRLPNSVIPAIPLGLGPDRGCGVNCGDNLFALREGEPFPTKDTSYAARAQQRVFDGRDQVVERRIIHRLGSFWQLRIQDGELRDVRDV